MSKKNYVFFFFFLNVGKEFPFLAKSSLPTQTAHGNDLKSRPSFNFESHRDRKRNDTAITCTLRVWVPASVSWCLAEINKTKLKLKQETKWFRTFWRVGNCTLEDLQVQLWDSFAAFSGEMTCLAPVCSIESPHIPPSWKRKAKSEYWLAVTQSWMTDWSILIVTFCICQLNMTRTSCLLSPPTRPLAF